MKDKGVMAMTLSQNLKIEVNEMSYGNIFLLLLKLTIATFIC